MNGVQKVGRVVPIRSRESQYLMTVSAHCPVFVASMNAIGSVYSEHVGGTTLRCRNPDLFRLLPVRC